MYLLHIVWCAWITENREKSTVNCNDYSESSGWTCDQQDNRFRTFKSPLRKADKNFCDITVEYNQRCRWLLHIRKSLQYWHMDTEAVAEQIEKIHAEYASVVQYNNENSLSRVLSIAYWYSVVRIIKGVWCISENLCARLFCFEKNFRIIDLNQVPGKTENERCSIIYCDNKSGTIFHIRKWNTELRKVIIIRRREGVWREN